MHKKPPQPSSMLPSLHLDKVSSSASSEEEEESPPVVMSCPISSSSENSSIRRHFHESSLAIPTIGSILKSNRDRETMNERSNRISLPHHDEEKKEDDLKVKESETKEGDDDEILSSSIDISEQEVYSLPTCLVVLLSMTHLFSFSNPTVGRSSWHLVVDSRYQQRETSASSIPFELGLSKNLSTATGPQA
jgi:hypothetical protein